MSARLFEHPIDESRIRRERLWRKPVRQPVEALAEAGFDAAVGQEHRHDEHASSGRMLSLDQGTQVGTASRSGASLSAITRG